MRFIEILSIDIKYKNLSTSRGDGNRLTSQRLNLQLTCKTTYSPREGTETKILRQVLKNSIVRKTTYSPREGTETPEKHLLTIHLSLYKNLSTSRGAGNRGWKIYGSPFLQNNLFTSRGAGNTQPNPACSSSLREQVLINLGRGRKPVPVYTLIF